MNPVRQTLGPGNFAPAHSEGSLTYSGDVGQRHALHAINGNMIAGYALIAYPDKWGSSGIMIFIVNQQGRVYRKNLGPRTAHIAAAIAEYDPDPSWKLVTE